MQIKSGTIVSTYSRNSLLLLTELLRASGDRKTIICYGKDNTIDLAKFCGRTVNVIQISREQIGYKGILNFYKIGA